MKHRTDKYIDKKINLGFHVDEETGEHIIMKEDFVFSVACFIRDYFGTKKLSDEVIKLIANENKLIDNE